MNLKELLSHETKKSSLIKYMLLLFIVIIYFLIMSYKYGIKSGFLVTLLTWSFFVFCTPIADAGFLLDFPIRLITKIRMIYSEIFIWIFATILNLTAIFFYKEIYLKAEILKIFYFILTHPIPYYSIIILSALGTYLSIYFGDELLDVIKHEQREKYKKHKLKYYLILILFLFVVIFFIYKKILTALNIVI